MTMIEVHEHASSSYAPRTFYNAKSSDLTIAFAVDFATAGERLTRKAAGRAYVSIPLGLELKEAVKEILDAAKRYNASTLNIAGNGIYTLAEHGWTQRASNLYVFKVLRRVTRRREITVIRSGGQTGIDIAGIVAAYVLGISAIATLPKGFLQRAADGVDRTQSKSDVEKQIRKYVRLLNKSLNSPD